ncbi:hypothetical protein N7513_005702 [Penicillium frequentans]|nr:hypothetical protein N7513_005702 [Penicillium glabrum]
MAASPKPAKPKSINPEPKPTNPKATTIPTITHPDATLEDPISLQWPKPKSPLEKPGLLFEDNYDSAILRP